MIEDRNLEALRDTASRTLIALLWLHVPLALTIALMRDTGWMLPTLLTAMLAVASTFAWSTAGNGLSTRLVFAVTVMGGVAVINYVLTGHSWQIDFHMYYFAALACLVAYCDYRPIVAGTAAVALHHLVLNFILPAAVFPGGTITGVPKFRCMQIIAELEGVGRGARDRSLDLRRARLPRVVDA